MKRHMFRKDVFFLINKRTDHNEASCYKRIYKNYAIFLFFFYQKHTLTNILATFIIIYLLTQVVMG